MSRHPAAGLYPALFHGFISLAAHLGGILPVRYAEPFGWDFFWQVVPIRDLQSHPWSTLWHMHFQPPGYSLWGWFWLQLAGPASFPQILRLVNAGLGMGIVYLTWRLALALLNNRRAALAAGLVMALNPAMLLYESYYGYEMLVAALVVASGWCLWRAVSVGPSPSAWRWLAAFALTLNALLMVRTLYHLIFLPVALAFAWPVWRELPRPRRAAFLMIAMALPGLWYAKNLHEYGFFGSSSWFGLSLYKCVAIEYGAADLKALENEKAIPPYVRRFFPYKALPSQYREFGFDRTSIFEAFNRDDFRNINMIAISRAYGEAAHRMIRRHPIRYLASILTAYGFYSYPPSGYLQLEPQRRGLLGAWDWLVTKFAYGAFVAPPIQKLTGWDCGSFFAFYFPGLIIFGIYFSLRLIRGADANQRSRALLMAYFVWVCSYTAIVGCMAEVGENMRFRFPTEPLTLIMLFMALLLMLEAWRQRNAGSSQ